MHMCPRRAWTPWVMKARQLGGWDLGCVVCHTVCMWVCLMDVLCVQATACGESPLWHSNIPYDTTCVACTRRT